MCLTLVCSRLHATYFFWSGKDLLVLSTIVPFLRVWLALSNFVIFLWLVIKHVQYIFIELNKQREKEIEISTQKAI